MKKPIFYLILGKISTFGYSGSHSVEYLKNYSYVIFGTYPDVKFNLFQSQTHIFPHFRFFFFFRNSESILAIHKVEFYFM